MERKSDFGNFYVASARPGEVGIVPVPPFYFAVTFALLRNECETKVALCAMNLLKMTIFCAKMLLLLWIDFCFV